MTRSFLSAFLAAARKMEPGDPNAESTTLGSMIDPESAARIETWVTEAEAAGARILLPARREKSKLWPVVAADVPRGAKLREEFEFLGSREIEEDDVGTRARDDCQRVVAADMMPGPRGI